MFEHGGKKADVSGGIATRGGHSLVFEYHLTQVLTFFSRNHAQHFVGREIFGKGAVGNLFVER